MKQVSKKERPAVSGGRRGEVGPYTDPVVPPVPDYPPIPVVATDPEDTGPGCG